MFVPSPLTSATTYPWGEKQKLPSFSEPWIGVHSRHAHIEQARQSHRARRRCFAIDDVFLLPNTPFFSCFSVAHQVLRSTDARFQRTLFRDSFTRHAQEAEGPRVRCTRPTVSAKDQNVFFFRADTTVIFFLSFKCISFANTYVPSADFWGCLGAYCFHDFCGKRIHLIHS